MYTCPVKKNCLELGEGGGSDVGFVFYFSKHIISAEISYHIRIKQYTESKLYRVAPYIVGVVSVVFDLQVPQSKFDKKPQYIVSNNWDFIAKVGIYSLNPL